MNSLAAVYAAKKESEKLGGATAVWTLRDHINIFACDVCIKHERTPEDRRVVRVIVGDLFSKEFYTKLFYVKSQRHAYRKIEQIKDQVLELAGKGGAGGRNEFMLMLMALRNLGSICMVHQNERAGALIERTDK